MLTDKMQNEKNLFLDIHEETTDIILLCEPFKAHIRGVFTNQQAFLNREKHQIRQDTLHRIQHLEKLLNKK